MLRYDCNANPITMDSWKTMIELAMTDLLRKSQLPELSYYQAGGGAIETPSKKRGAKTRRYRWMNLAIPSDITARTTRRILRQEGLPGLARPAMPFLNNSRSIRSIVRRQVRLRS